MLTQKIPIIMKYWKYVVMAAFVFAQMNLFAQRAEDYQTVAEDGAWCWFSDPRAVYYKNQEERSYVGYVTSEGDITIAYQDYKTGETNSTVIYEDFQKDDHVNPSILFLPDGRLKVFFTRHNGDIYHTTSLKPEDISAFEEVEVLKLGNMLCYTNPVMLSEENNKIYVFFRGGKDWKPSFISSEDLGKTWSEPISFVSKKVNNKYNRPYTKVVSDGKSTIHFAFTDGHPREENHNSVYYLKYEGGKFFDAEGAQMGDMNSLPIIQETIPKAYDGVDNNARAWIWDIALNEKNNPVMVYTTLPEETKHNYHYAYWNGQDWVNKKITGAGAYFPTPNIKVGGRNPEPHYSAGITLDHTDPSVVYLSKPVDGVYEIQKWWTKDGAESFENEPVTVKSLKNNVRPFVVRNAPSELPNRLLWMNIKHYNHYTNYNTSIKGSSLGEKPSTEWNKRDVSKAMTLVADWQIDNFDRVKHHELDWTNGALYTGMMQWAKIAEDQKYMDWLWNLGKRNGWQPHKRIYHADDIVVGQMYLEMYKQKMDTHRSYLIMAPTQAQLDWVYENPSKGNLLLNWRDQTTLERWSWCDALFMAPPVWVKMAEITGDKKYLKFMHKEFMATYDFLYDHEEDLFFRDHNYFPEKKLEANGKKMFWGRGNGWVMGGLVSMLKDLPEKSKYRKFYEELFVEMAVKVASLQGDDGFWRASMLDPDSYPNGETSSSGFFTFAIAYGVNSGLLDRDTYLPVVQKGWNALVSAVHADGKLGWVQPIGENPKNVTSEMTEVYGVGAFLLAGSEIMSLLN